MRSKRVTELSLFTGIGGGVYGSKLLGWQTIGYVESNDYCQRVIAQRIADGVFDYAPIFSDVRTFASTYADKYRGLADVITAGFPCQPFSVAGKIGTDSDNRNMWKPTLEVIRRVTPRFVLLENVTGLLGRHRYFETILKDLAQAGYDAQWMYLSASDIGAPHRRTRLWTLATNTYSNGQEGSSNYRDCEARDSAQQRAWESPDRNIVPRGWWEIEPAVGRVAHGIAAWSDRITALGNAQVPAVVKSAWEIMNNTGRHHE